MSHGREFNRVEVEHKILLVEAHDFFLSPCWHPALKPVRQYKSVVGLVCPLPKLLEELHGESGAGRNEGVLRVAEDHDQVPKLRVHRHIFWSFSVRPKLTPICFNSG